MMIRAVSGIVAFVGLIALLSAAEPLSYRKDVEPIFQGACGDCHGAKRPKKGLVLTERGRENLLDVPSRMEPDQKLLVAGDPAASYLWTKLEHRQKEGQGMPRTIFSAKKLPAEQLEVIKRWIEEGAAP